MANLFKLTSLNSSGVDTDRFTVDDETGVAITTALAVGGALAVTGDLTSPAKSDGSLFVGITDFTAITGTWTPTRVAANDYALIKTATDETATLSASLRKMFRTTASKGIKITSIDLIYKIATADLDAHSAILSSVTFANNTANAVATHGGSLGGTLATAVQTNPYVTRLTPATPAYLATAADIRLEVTVNAAETSVYSLYGALVNYDFALL